MEIKRFKKTLMKLWIAIGIMFILYIIYSYQSHGVDNAYYISNDIISVENTKDYYSFTPQKEFQEVFVFYLGALVSPKAYVPLCRKLAEHNIQTYILKMPWRLVSKGYNKPKDLGLLVDTTKRYILAGHSQGAKIAAQFLYENPKSVNQLILIGSSHPRDISLAKSNLPILKIYGSKDGIAKEKTMIQNQSRLPAHTKYVRIEGANHSQFGYYGFQLGDHKATISRTQQQEKLVDLILAFIQTKGSLP